MRSIFLFALIVVSSVCFSQSTDEKLAAQFFENQEFEKASEMYRKLYKENDNSEVGMGLDPYFYPRSGAATWSKLLNKALAMIVNSLGYLDYTLSQ